ncbi:hypothetical protein KPH14_001699 [Odynerus spinipes]|uniref:Uncharacterized protein n=1 Tax=Odynerus spinipes TaxID=1348599 RepID=A0AAD9VVS9_9HYME|nr:hypothetical protein KPH14_001699 [Odynerus spinipes]
MVNNRQCPLVSQHQWRCEEATEVETHHQQTAATTMGVAEDDTPSSLTSHPNLNTNNPSQEGRISLLSTELVL